MKKIIFISLISTILIASFSFVVGITMANDAKAQSHHKDKVKTRLELKQEQQEKAFELKHKKGAFQN